MNMSSFNRFLYAPWESLSLRERIGVLVIMINAYLGSILILAIFSGPITVINSYMPEIYIKMLHYFEGYAKEHLSRASGYRDGLLFIVPVYVACSIIQLIVSAATITRVYIDKEKERLPELALIIMPIAFISNILLTIFPGDEMHYKYDVFLWEFRLGHVALFNFFLFCIHISLKWTILYSVILFERWTSKGDKP